MQEIDFYVKVHLRTDAVNQASITLTDAMSLFSGRPKFDKQKFPVKPMIK